MNKWSKVKNFLFHTNEMNPSKFLVFDKSVSAINSF